jgi:tetratricopeptide (TPR) repeat protein
MNATGFPDPSKQLSQFMRDRSVGRYLSQQRERVGSLKQARVLVDSGRQSDARPILERITARKGSQEARFLLGIACYRLRDFEAAREHCAAVLRSDPGHASAAYYLGLSLKAQGRVIESMAAFRRAQAIRPR